MASADGRFDPESIFAPQGVVRLKAVAF